MPWLIGGIKTLNLNIIHDLCVLIITITTNFSSYPDIPAGESVISDGIYRISISEDWPVIENIPIQVNVLSHDNLCWRDTFSILVVGLDQALDNSNSFIRIFPNPVNDIASIQTNYITDYAVEILSLSGQSLFRGEAQESTYQLDLSSFQKGVYFITIRSKDFVETRKIIKL